MGLRIPAESRSTIQGGRLAVISDKELALPVSISEGDLQRPHIRQITRIRLQKAEGDGRRLARQHCSRFADTLARETRVASDIGSNVDTHVSLFQDPCEQFLRADLLRPFSIEKHLEAHPLSKIDDKMVTVAQLDRVRPKPRDETGQRHDDRGPTTWHNPPESDNDILY
jgi:hypothetical protein